MASTVEAPPAALAERLGFLLKSAQLSLGTRVEPALASLDLGGREFAVLSVLVDEGPRSQQRLSERMRVDRTTMVALVDGLERKGLVERRRQAEDRRAYEIHVLPKGRRTQSRAQRVVEAAEDDLLAPLSGDDRHLLRELLLNVVSVPRATIRER